MGTDVQQLDQTAGFYTLPSFSSLLIQLLEVVNKTVYQQDRKKKLEIIFNRLCWRGTLSTTKTLTSSQSNTQFRT